MRTASEATARALPSPSAPGERANGGEKSDSTAYGGSLAGAVAPLYIVSGPLASSVVKVDPMGVATPLDDRDLGAPEAGVIRG
jgi:hypothetical protein